MVQLDLALFGRFEASVSQQPVTKFRTDKMRALVAYLTMNAERPFRREILATLLWPDWPDAAARRNLRQSLHRVRQMLDKVEPSLGESLLTMTRQTVQLNGTAVSLDVTRFQQHLQACENHTHTHLHQCHHCLDHMEKAAALYQGDLLAGFTLKDAFPFEEWLLMQREQLQQQMLELLDKLATAYEQQGAYEQAQQATNRQVLLAPWRESAHRQLMQLYMQQGQRSAALAQFVTCKQLLETELGVDPAPETIALWRQIKNDSFGVEPAETAVSAPPTATTTHGFPTQFTPFIGRQQTLDQLISNLADENCRLLTLIAPGGMGKTRLAIQVGQELKDGSLIYPDGAYFIPLATVAHVDLLAITLAQHLGLVLTEHRTPQAELLHHLQDKALLLVCDNFEQVEDGASLLAEILAQAPRVRLLVTSRQPLNLQAEWRQTIIGLDYQAGESSEAVRFFQRNARRVAPQFQWDEAALTAVLDLCALVEGMPLALEIAAAWTRLMDCPTILRETKKSLDFLTSPLGDLPARHQSIRAVLMQSWQLLTPRLQTILGQLALFTGSFALDAALTIVPDLSMLDMATLLDRALLRWQPNGRYQMHELLRQFAASQPQGTLEQFRENHGRFYLTLMANQESHLLSKNPQSAIAVLQQEFDHVRQAWQWAVEMRDEATISTAANALLLYHESRGTLDEGRQQFSLAAQAFPKRAVGNRLRLAEAKCLEALGNLSQAIKITRRVVQQLETASNSQTELTELTTLTKLQALIRLGRLYERTSKYTLADKTLRAALPLAQPFSLEAAQIWNILGLILRYRGDANDSIKAHKKALTICQTLEDELETAETLSNLCLSYKDIAAYDTAINHVQQALAIVKRLNHREKICGFTHSLGVIYWLQEKLAEAEACWLESLAVAEEINLKRIIAICCNGLGIIARRTHRYDEALRYLNRALHLSQELQDRSLQGVMLGIIGSVYHDIGQLEEAITYTQQAAAMTHSSGAVTSVGIHLGNIGDFLLLRHRYEEALSYFEEAIAYLRQGTADYYLGWVLVSYATCLFEHGRFAEATTANTEGSQLATQFNRRFYKLRSQLLQARLQAQAGEIDAALARLSPLQQQFNTPEDRAEIEYTSWQITKNPTTRAAAEKRFAALYKKTKQASYQTRFPS
ncbi:MAG: tetratricopeptide repeat protein [Chloroflexota bacterium]